jgi:hypothetical protein
MYFPSSTEWHDSARQENIYSKESPVYHGGMLHGTSCDRYQVFVGGRKALAAKGNKLNLSCSRPCVGSCHKNYASFITLTIQTGLTG